MVTINKSSRRFAAKAVLYFFRYNYFCITIGKAKLCGATFVFKKTLISLRTGSQYKFQNVSNRIFLFG